MQGMMTRILFTWAIRHPACAYVQGINDLCAPLLLVFLSEYVLKADKLEDDLNRVCKGNIQINKQFKSIFRGQNEELKKEQLEILFDHTKIANLLRMKKRHNVYDVKEEDF